MSSDIKRYRDNLRDELNGAVLYTALASAETDAIRGGRHLLDRGGARDDFVVNIIT
jgi:hypothetical protein